MFGKVIGLFSLEIVALGSCALPWGSTDAGSSTKGSAGILCVLLQYSKWDTLEGLERRLILQSSFDF